MFYYADVFHLKCLDAYCRQYPVNTAPAGYVCPPPCSHPIFPASNLVSPVADVMRSVLANRPWAREGLGLPLLAYDNAVDVNPPEIHQTKIAAVQKAVTNYSVVNVEGEVSNTIHRNEPGRNCYLLPTIYKVVLNVVFI